MKVSQATKSFLDYHRMNSKKKHAQKSTTSGIAGGL